MVKPRPESIDTAENITNYPQQIQHTLVKHQGKQPQEKCIT